VFLQTIVFSLAVFVIYALLYALAIVRTPMIGAVEQRIF
jgi:hypothetical protein